MNNYKLWDILKPALLLGLVLASVVALSLTQVDPVTLHIPFLPDVNYLLVFGSFFLLSLMIERSVEWYVNTYRNSADHEGDLVYKMQTRSRALWVAIVLSVLVSMFGPKILSSILETTDLSGVHSIGFMYSDIVLTAFSLAGGTQLWHPVMRWISMFTGIKLPTLSKTDTPHLRIDLLCLDILNQCLY